MTPAVSYKQFVKNAKDRTLAREILKRNILSGNINISETARSLNISRNTLKKLIRDEDLNYEAKCKPKTCPHKTKPLLAGLVLAYSEIHGYGAPLLKANFDLPCCAQTIHRILVAHNMTHKIKRKYIKKRQVKSIRQYLQAFEKWQLDTKYLTDIPALAIPIHQGHSPKYEYTLRDVYTGTTFLGYGFHERSLKDSLVFVSLCLAHMQLHGIDTHYVNIQSDNGSEFLGSLYQKKEFEMQRLVEKDFNGRFNTIPPGRPTWNSHVESFHGRVEPEFYDITKFNNLKEFVNNAQNFTKRWNTKRKSIKYRKTPEKLASEQAHLLPKCFYNFPVLVYDQLELPIFSPRGGQNLPRDLNHNFFYAGFPGSFGKDSILLHKNFHGHILFVWIFCVRSKSGRRLD